MGSSAERDRILNSLLGQPLWGNHRISAIEFIYFSPGNLLHRVELKSKGARAAASPLAVALEKSGAG
jgi:hypothetical protein